MKIKLSKVFIGFSSLGLVAAFAFAQAGTSTIIVGGDRDSHGCIGSAGYSWSTSSQACVRPWEQTNDKSKTPNSDEWKDNKFKNDDSNRFACNIFLKDLKLGDGNDKDGKREDVKDLQDKLREKGYLSVASTGYFGPATKKAITKYQKDNNISPTGYIGEKTRGQLRNHFCMSNSTTTKPIAVCDYAAPVNGCKYIPGANYNPETQCGMVLDCSASTTTSYNPEQDKNCKVWNDGCNTCSRTSSTGPAACTMMACFTSNKPYCKEYFSTTSN